MTHLARLLRIFLFTILLVAVAAGLHAQTSTAALSGTVRDTSGAVVAKAAVGLTNSGTGAARSVSTDGQGRYNFSIARDDNSWIQIQEGG